MRFSRTHQRRSQIEILDTDILSVDGSFQYQLANGILLDFESFVPCLGAAVTRKWALELCQYYLRFAVRTVKARRDGLLDLFKWLNNQPVLCRRIRRNSHRLTVDPSKNWQHAVASYVDQRLTLPYRNNEIRSTTYVEKVGALFLLIDHLASVGLAPSCNKPQPPHNYHAAGKQRPTLLELHKSNAPPSVVADLLARAKHLGINDEDAEMKKLLAALAGRVSTSSMADETSFARAIYELNDEALKNLRTHVEKTYMKWAAVHQRGQTLLAGVGIPVYRDQ